MEFYVIQNTPYVGLSIYTFILLIVAAIIGYSLFGIYYYRISRFAPEAKVYAAARRKKLDIARITDSDGVEEVYLAVKEGKDDPFLKKHAYGIQIDPKLQSISQCSRTRDGISIHNFSVHFPFSISPHNAMAIQTILEYVRSKSKYKPLDFLPDDALIDLIGTPRDHLEDDIQLYLDEYKPEIEKDMFIQMIEDIQDETGALPTTKNKISYKLAYELIPSSFSGFDLQRMRTIIEEIMQRKLAKEELWMKLGIIFAGIIISGAVAFAIIVSVR